jgi:hypothetical protein
MGTLTLLNPKEKNIMFSKICFIREKRGEGGDLFHFEFCPKGKGMTFMCIIVVVRI